MPRIVDPVSGKIIELPYGPEEEGAGNRERGTGGAAELVQMLLPALLQSAVGQAVPDPRDALEREGLELRNRGYDLENRGREMALNAPPPLSREVEGAATAIRAQRGMPTAKGPLTAEQADEAFAAKRVDDRFGDPQFQERMKEGATAYGRQLADDPRVPSGTVGGRALKYAGEQMGPDMDIADPDAVEALRKMMVDAVLEGAGRGDGPISNIDIGISNPRMEKKLMRDTNPRRQPFAGMGSY